MIDTTAPAFRALLAQIDDLAEALNDEAVATVQEHVERAFSEDGPLCNPKLEPWEDHDYQEGFMAGIIWTIVLARRGSNAVRSIIDAPATKMGGEG